MNPRYSLTLVPSRFTVPALLLAVCVVFSSRIAPAQQDSSPKRKILNRTPAPYPALARNMALSGTVRVEALVTPEGTVKTVDIKGGHPVLAQAAANTVRQWKWEPQSHETRELVEIRFSPPE